MKRRIRAGVTIVGLVVGKGGLPPLLVLTLKTEERGQATFPDL